ncbi:MAG: 3-hydroxyacyl-[acyl-carrier-protein] dehydratase [Candidatus Omnitrophota bacterium]|jgi:3-hydroxyacyl-[acyl-carrier-protein] dehydratase
MNIDMTMRWMLIDKYTDIVKGKFCRGLRSITRSEGALLDNYPCYPVMPSSLLIEMMAQVGGVLIGASIDFEREVVLAKVTDASFTHMITPPCQLTIEAELEELGDDAGMTKCQVLRGAEVVATSHIFFGLFKALGDEGKKSMVFSKDFMESFALKQIIEAGQYV